MHETLAAVAATVKYKPGWRVTLDTTGGWGPVIRIQAQVYDSNPPHHPMVIDHVRPIPCEIIDPAKCREFIRDKVLEVERHELREWLRFGDERPFYPPHGDEGDPYS